MQLRKRTNLWSVAADSQTIVADSLPRSDDGLAFLHWPFIGVFIGLCLSLLCCIVCEKSYAERYAHVDSHSMNPDSLWASMANSSKDGLFGHEYRFLGFNIESKHDWRGFRPTEYRGLPGGRWTLYATVLITCTLLGFLPLLFRKRVRAIHELS